MRIEVMSRRGHEVFAEWDVATSPLELKAIDEGFQAWRRKGYYAFGAVSGQRVDSFSPNIEEDLVLIAPVVGG